MNRIRISEEAIEDLNSGFLFYEAQEFGLGDYFLSCIRSEIETLRISAGTHRLVHRDYHRLVGKVFPHGIFYTFSEGVAIVWAVIDLRRDPSWIAERLGPTTGTGDDPA